MTTSLDPVLNWGHGLTETGGLVDRFWAAVNVEQANARNSVCSIDEIIWAEECLQTPEIFVKSGSRPVVNVRSLGSPTEPHGSECDDQWPFCTSTQLSSGSFLFPDAPWATSGLAAAPQITVQPATPSMTRSAFQRIPRKPKLLIPKMVQRRGNGVSSPGSALLALASDFLSVIVKLGRSQPSTPAGGLGESGVCVLESDVLITVFDDAVRSAPASQWRDVEELAGFKQGTSAGVLDTYSSNTMLSPLSTRAQAGSAEELDNLAKISWERQLMNVQGTLWH